MPRAARLVPALLLVLALLPVPAPAQLLAPPPQGDPAKEAEKLVERLAAGDFAAVEARFDDKMKAALPPGGLAKTWRELGSQLGAYRSHGAATVSTISGMRVADVPTTFERATVLLRLPFDAQGRLAGLRVLPAEGAAGPKPSGPSPLPPYASPGSYTESEVTAGAAGWPLPATLTRPSGPGPFPAVVLVHGSGPNDRDETVGGAKVFRDLAVGLASRGIVVLRYDKRTKVFGQKMASDPALSTLASEVVDDAAAAASLLWRTPGVDPARVFVVGHSLGAMLLPRIAAATQGLAGVVGLATGARSLDRMILAQTEYLLRSSGLSGDALKQQMASTEAEIAKMRRLAAGEPESPVMGAGAGYWKEILALDPPAEYARMATPALLLQGERDYQVTMEDFAAMRKAIAGKTGWSAKSYPRLNHLFVSGDGPSLPAEYQKPAFVEAAVVDDLAAFVLGRRAPRK